MHEWSMLSAHELIEPKSASASQTDCGSAAILRLRSMSATASPYAAKTPIEQARMQIWPKLPASMASGARVLQDLKEPGQTCQRRCGGHMTTYNTVVVG